MNVILINEEQLKDKGFDYEYATRTPDGRVVLPLNVLKVLTNITPTIVSTQELEKLMRESKKEAITTNEESEVKDE